MPQVIKVGPYVVFFWLDEGKPLEPIHVHVVEGVPRANATKVWITQSGKALLATRQSEIPAATLRKLLRIIEANVDEIRSKWLDYFDEISYYC
ncbi:MAG: DUF4160 domain-containing protein [Oscillospiraceae bacterium]|nr:DUF4160 domain-containing protein [Oscillospiraceae bacterium]